MSFNSVTSSAVRSEDRQAIRKKQVFYWSLYDFGCSVAMITFLVYFSEWLVIERGVSDLWYNMLYAIGTALLFFTAPRLGKKADRSDKPGKRHAYLRVITVAAFIFFLLTSYAAVGLRNAFLAAFLFIFANYFYQFAFVFYNGYISDLGPDEKRGLISGIGQMGNWLGQVVGLLISLFFAGGVVFLFGVPGRTQVFLPATLVFGILVLPMLFLYKKGKGGGEIVEKDLVSGMPDDTRQSGESIFKVPGVGMYLAAFFLFSDALITASTNYPIFLSRVFHVSSATSSLVIISVLATSAIGAVVSGSVSDRIGLRRSLLIVIGSFLIILPLVAVVTSFFWHVVVMITMGFMYGATWAVTRSAMIYLCPAERLNHGLSYYTLAERFSTLIGPLAWGLTVWLLSPYGAFAYRMAVMVMSVFVLIGFYMISKIKEFA